MPSMVGFINVVAVGSSSVFTVGDVFYMSPTSYATTYAGSGSFNTGDGLYVSNYENNTNVEHCPQIDQPIVGNF